MCIRDSLRSLIPGLPPSPYNVEAHDELLPRHTGVSCSFILHSRSRILLQGPLSRCAINIPHTSNLSPVVPSSCRFHLLHYVTLHSLDGPTHTAATQSPPSEKDDCPRLSVDTCVYRPRTGALPMCDLFPRVPLLRNGPLLPEILPLTCHLVWLSFRKRASLKVPNAGDW